MQINMNEFAFLYSKLIQPKSADPDLRSKEFFFNVLLAISIFLISVALTISIINPFISDPEAWRNNALPPAHIFAVFILFLCLFLLSRRGKIGFSILLFLAVYYSLPVCMIYKWGIEVPAGLLFFVLVITISGILVSSRFAFFLSLFSVILISGIHYLHLIGVISPNLYWKKNETMGMIEVVVIALIFLTIATVSWLSNREIKKSLDRARRSEAELKKERDSLEIKVAERTRQLQKAQMEKMKQLNRFAEFGRLSAGLFHDLVNHLTAVSLIFETLKQREAGDSPHFSQARSNMDKAIKATRKMGDFVRSVQKQIANQESQKLFSLGGEIREAIQILSYLARKNRVTIEFKESEEIKTFGNPIKFRQAAMNLLANAIDSYGSADDGAEPADPENARKIRVKLGRANDIIGVSVQDWGAGIPPAVMSNIFEPFFTTKGAESGTGISLFLTKCIVEEDFGGTIAVKSEEGRGTVFTVRIPQTDKADADEAGN